ncbi:MAG: sensor-containing diguanylate cyclase/phosphodiesterase, partial [Frankiales bacterium]|nr:sensor-containing diguanylate cyclase/phosphodiesterase [Frankiales bacterium]
LLAEDVVLGVVQVALRRDRSVPAEELDLLAELGHTAGQAVLRCRLPAHLRGLPLRDAVTGTAAPALFGERVGAALARSAEAAEPVTVLLVDVATGIDPTDAPVPAPNELMAELGARLRRLEGSASTARVGPHRFAVLREGCDAVEAAIVADVLHDALHGPLPSVEVVVPTVGAAVVDPAADGRSVSVSTLLGWASGALHDALGRGPGRRVVHGPSTRQAARALVGAERELRRALDEDDVVVHYQPIVNLRTGRVLGVETLCRLRLPDGSLQLPSHFIDAAEDSGLVVPLGRHTLVAACTQQRRWARAGTHLDVAVNVAATQAGDPGFAQEVLDVLAGTGCPAQRLVLELTESALLAAAPSTLRSFAALRAAGVRVALDDFGTRYASLDYVRSFPLDELKIDQAFVAGLPLSRVARAIVRMVAQLAAELDLACVAEGIETAGQAAFLRDLGVLGQGFALGRPVPADEVVTWVTPTSWLGATAVWGDEGQPPSVHRA